MTDPISESTTIQSTSYSYVDSPAFQALTTSVQDVLVSSLSVDELNQLFPSFPTLATPNVSVNDFFKSISETTRNNMHQLQLNEEVDQLTRNRINQASSIKARSFTDLFDIILFETAQLTNTAGTAVNNLQAYMNQLQTYVNAQNARIATLNAENTNELNRINTLKAAYTTFINTIKASPISAVETPPNSGNFVFQASTNPNATTRQAETQAKIDAYNAAALVFQQAVSSFNTYMNGRRNQIDTYNTGTTNYNNQISASNSPVQDINQMQTDYNLNPPVPIPSTSVTRPASGGFPTANFPNIDVSSIPSLITYNSSATSYSFRSVNPATSTPWINETAASILIPSLPSYTPVDALSTYYDQIFQGLYDTVITPLNDELYQSLISWSATFLMMILNPDQFFPDTTLDPLLNTKKISEKVLPDAIVQSKNPLKIAGTGITGLNVQGALTSEHVQGVLGKSIVMQAITDLNLNIDKDRLNVIANQLTVGLSSVVLSDTAFQALLPSLGPLSDVLAKLPPNSPAFSLLFAISFANRLQENISQGQTEATLQGLIENIPELQNLNAADLQNLISGLNVGLLLVSTKLLTETLGVPELLPQLINLILNNPELVSQITTAASTQNQQAIEQLQNQLEQIFINQGFAQPEAQFLAQIGANFINQSLTLAPSATTISRDTIQVDTLKDSLTAQLILSGYQLEEATNISETAVNRTLDKGTLTPERFNVILESNLRRLNVDNRSEIASQVLLIPAETNLPTSEPPSNEPSAELPIPPSTSNIRSTVSTQPPIPSLTLPPESQTGTSNIPSTEAAGTEVAEGPAVGSQQTTNVSSTNTNASSVFSTPSTPATNSENETTSAETVSTQSDQRTTARPTTALSEAELIALLIQRTKDLLLPQLDADLTKIVSEQLAKALFGTPNPDYADRADLKSPYSLVNAVKDQVYHLNIDNNEKYAEKVSDTFKDSIRSTIDLPAFFQKIMDPAYLFVYSVHTGIMYAGNEPSNWKKSIDIPV